MPRRKILLAIADDDRLTELSALLTNEGYDVVPARNGRDALSIINFYLPHLVIADITMPLMDGYQLWRTLRSPGYEPYAAVPFIFISPLSPSACYPQDAMHVWSTPWPVNPREMSRFLRLVKGIISPEMIIAHDLEEYGFREQMMVFVRDTALLNKLRGYLEEDRYEVAVVLDEMEALVRIEQENYSCIFLDCRDRDQEALITLFKRLRLRSQSLGVILLTSPPNVDTAVSLLQHGANDYIVTPLTEWAVESALCSMNQVRKAGSSCYPATGKLTELHELLRKKNCELIFLQEISARLAGEENPEEVPQLILDGLRGLVDYDIATVMTLEEGMLRVIAAKGVADASKLLDLAMDAEANPRLQKVISEKKGKIFKDPSEADPFDGILEIKKIHSCLVAPLLLGDRIMGLLTVDKGIAGLYDDETLMLVSTLAHHAAISLERSRRYRTLEEEATVDSLTGVYNRRYLEIAIQQEEARSRRSPTRASVIMVDADGVKTVNDRFGHAEGDKFLRRIAHLLKENCRSNDIVARYGGDEFVVLMPETTLEGAQRYINLIMDKIESEPSFRLPESIHLTISIGAACSMGSGGVLKALKVADARMYQHKQQKKTPR